LSGDVLFDTWCSLARLSPAGKFLAGLRRAVGDGGLRLVIGISFGFLNRSVQCFLGKKKKKKKRKKRETCRETEKCLVIYVHDLNQMSVASCRCNEGRKKKSLKRGQVAHIILTLCWLLILVIDPYFGMWYCFKSMSILAHS
jgi:hypothetical protein